MSETKFEMKEVLNYVDEGIILGCDIGTDIVDKLEYIRKYFIDCFYDKDRDILKIINEIFILYYIHNEQDLKTHYIKLRELIMDSIRYEKTIS